MKVLYVNCGWRREYESDIRSNEHYSSSSENKIAFTFTCLSAAHIRDFHIITVIYSSLHGFIWNQHSNQLPVGLLAQLVEHCPVSQGSGVQTSYRPESFSGLIFTTAQVVFITAQIAFMFKTSYVKKKFNVLACEAKSRPAVFPLETQSIIATNHPRKQCFEEWDYTC